MKKIEKTVIIQATPAKVWNVLTLDQYTRSWYAAFKAGAYAVTDWKQGSKAYFMDEDKNGMAAKIAESIPGQSLVIEYTGFVKDGIEDLDSPQAKRYQGANETYRLTSIGDATRLDMTSDMEESMYEMMSERWEKAIAQLKELAEQA